MRAEQATAPVADHGEGVVHHPGWPGPRWVDMHRGDLLQLDLSSGNISRAHTGDSVAAMLRPRRDGGIVVATRADLRVYTDLAAWNVEPEVDLDADRISPSLLTASGERLNEGGCDPQGRVLIGGLTEPRVTGGSAVYRVSAEGTIETVIADVTVANGLCFNDSGQMFHIDTPTRTIRRLAFEQPVPWRLEPFIDTSGEEGWPDGMCIDADGGLWVAMYGGSAVLRFDENGHVSERLELPVSRVTSCSFGPHGSTSLWITTSTEGAEDERRAGAGAVFVADVGVSGRPVLESAF